MRKSFVIAGVLGLAGAAPLAAQQTDCTAQATEVQDACQKAVDIFNYVAPQLGTAIAGGNATLGQGGVLGGFPHFSIGLRVNAVAGSLPQMDAVDFSTSGRQASTYETETYPVPMPQVDAAVGIFGGFPVPFVTRIGGLDLLLSATYVPTFESEGIALQEGGLKIGYGARLGLLKESMTVPGVAVTYMKRDLPVVDIIGVSEDGGALSSGADTVALNDLSLETTAWRITASKSFFIFGLAIGAGQDRYESDARLDIVVNESDPLAGNARYDASITFDQSMTRTTYFADLYMNLLALKIIGEVGLVQGGDVTTFNTFGDKKADDPRMYGSLGFRVGF